MAATVPGVMDAVGNGLTLIVNGLLTMVGWAASWPVLLGLVTIVSLTYLAHLEIGELDRSSAKPEVERH